MNTMAPTLVSKGVVKGVPALCNNLLSACHNMKGLFSRGLVTAVSSSKRGTEALDAAKRNPFMVAFLSTYVLSEVVFYFYFRFHLIPCANETRPAPDVYHDYPSVSERVILFRRILSRLRDRANRIHKQMLQDGIQSDLEQCFRKIVRDNFLQWFEYKDDETDKSTQSKGSDNLQVIEASDPHADKRPLHFSFLGSIRRKDTEMSGTSYTTGTTTETASNDSNDSKTSRESSSSSCSASISDSSSVSTSQSDQHDNVLLRRDFVPEWSIAGLHRKDIHDFLAWAFFNKDVHHLQPEERRGVHECISCLQEIGGLVGDDQYTASSQADEEDGSRVLKRSESKFESRRMSLENVRATHRPWISYGVTEFSVFAMRRVVLPLMGFRKITADSAPMVAWYRPANKSTSASKVCLFFHGIAPSGLLFYLPMIQGIFGDRQQSLILFENPSISCQFNGPEFKALQEEESAFAVAEILRKAKVSPKAGLTLMGHSFGSVTPTWVLRRRHHPNFFHDYRIEHVVLLDPVSLLLSEPTVMAKFLYDRSNAKLTLVSSELFTEYYLRRHFCWYNAELWLEDFCHGNDDLDNEGGHHNDYPKFTIVLSGMDEIVPSSVVHDHVMWLKDQSTVPDFDCNLVYLPHAAHGHCIVLPKFWSRIRKLVFPPTAAHD